MAEKSCTYCGGETLEPGFIADYGQGSQGYANWVPGPLETGIFGGAKLFGKERLEISAARCVKCGHLELFVLDQPQAGFEGTIP